MNEKLAQSAPVRLDKWLWAARFFKTRSLATDAIKGGKVHVNGTRVKPSKEITCGVTLTISQGQTVRTVVVKAVSAKRGSATIASVLYEETGESIQKREALEQLRKLAMPTLQSEHKPTKKNRRSIIRFKQGGGQ